jgi:hypothetical protein
MFAAKLLPVSVVATTRPPIHHRWLFHVFNWRFGVVEFFGWREGASGGSIVFVGPLSVETDLTAPAVAATTAGILTGAIALAVFAIRSMKLKP